MTPVTALLGLMAGAWSVRSICIKTQSTPKKVIKSIVAAGFFLGLGGLGAEEDKFVPVIILLAVGAVIQLIANKRDKSAAEKNNKI
ncbi:hypothetical protein J8I88_06880 [Duffyella gerundensis]|uniref:hypothetical protein n=1 Tax=Duffyella gerundensis TaxID=1619313 RepID=UPI001AE79785|nr:hypothetical protein [Duffyella gerundensis]QTO55571.1 hypothetical protein J8I88_06880 [Duffyella gerundensis]